MPNVNSHSLPPSNPSKKLPVKSRFDNTGHNVGNNPTTGLPASDQSSNAHADAVSHLAGSIFRAEHAVHPAPDTFTGNPGKVGVKVGGSKIAADSQQPQAPKNPNASPAADEIEGLGE